MLLSAGGYLLHSESHSAEKAGWGGGHLGMSLSQARRRCPKFFCGGRAVMGRPGLRVGFVPPLQHARSPRVSDGGGGSYADG